MISVGVYTISICIHAIWGADAIAICMHTVAIDVNAIWGADAIAGADATAIGIHTI